MAPTVCSSEGMTTPAVVYETEQSLIRDEAVRDESVRDEKAKIGFLYAYQQTGIAASTNSIYIRECFSPPMHSVYVYARRIRICYQKYKVHKTTLEERIRLFIISII